METPFLGTVQYFAFNYAPRGWALCNGQTLQITANQALFALLGTYYGGDGRTTFGVPDLQGRAIVGIGPGGGGLSAYSMGQKLGTESMTIPASALPSHTHTVPAISIAASSNNTDPGLLATNNFPAPFSPDVYAATATAGAFLGAPAVNVTPAGGGQPVNIINPYIALTCCIATAGLFPSRN